jgi:hypothetical protein
MLENNYGVFDKIIEQLMKEVRLHEQVKDCSDFQELLQSLPWLLKAQQLVQIQSDDVDIQQFAALVREQNDVTSKV